MRQVIVGGRGLVTLHDGSQSPSGKQIYKERIYGHKPFILREFLVLPMTESLIYHVTIMISKAHTEGETVFYFHVLMT